MKLSHDEVRRIAKLARLELTDDEVELFSGQLSGILSFADALSEVNTDGVAPVDQITGLENVLHEDTEKDCAYSDDLLAQSPQPVRDRMIRVGNVFDN